MKLKMGIARRVMLLTALASLVAATWFCVSKGMPRHGHPSDASSTSVASQPSSPTDTDHTEELMAPDLRGKSAPAFTLNNLYGEKVSLADFRGHAVVVNFWATYCEPCTSEMPSLEAMQQKYSARGLTTLGINQDEGIGNNKIAMAAKRLGVTYPILMPARAVSKRYGGIDYLPETFYINRNGIILAQTTGARTNDQIEADIRKVLGESL